MRRALLVALALCAAPPALGGERPPDPRDRGPDRLDVSSYPRDQQQRYPLFVVRCSKCHSLARPINSRFDVVAWKRYAKRMINRPNSGINEEDAQELYAFLKYFASRSARAP